MGTFAAAPDLSFNWYDAAKLSQSIRKEFAKKHFPTQKNIENIIVISPYLEQKIF